MARHPSRLRRLAPLGLAVGVGAVALAARLLAVDRLPVDFDEDDYLRAGQQYAIGLQAGDPLVLLRDNYRSEPPAPAPRSCCPGTPPPRSPRRSPRSSPGSR